MDCSVPVSPLEQHEHPQTRSDSSVSILQEKENSDLRISIPPTSHTVGDSTEPSLQERVNSDLPTSIPPDSPPTCHSTESAVCWEVSPANESYEDADDGKNAQRHKGKKVTFVTVKRLESALDLDLEKGVTVNDVGEAANERSRCEDDAEKVCRVCHLSSDNLSGPGDLIQLGCGCKDDLGIAHRYCAEAWFKIRGNSLCEICGETAKNIVGIGETNFVEEWSDRELSNNSPSETTRCWRGQPLCNFLMACMVVAFILPWFFRVSMF